MLDRIKRLLRHRWFDEASLRRALPPAAMQRLTERVRASEQGHGGEIRIYVEAGLPTSYLLRRASTKEITRQRALTLFGKLRVWDTEHNNGVLIYLLLAERAIEIVADRGLDHHVPTEQWQAMLERMGSAFRAGRFEEGLAQALGEVSALLARHFPADPRQPDRNELPDEPVLG